MERLSASRKTSRRKRPARPSQARQLQSSPEPTVEPEPTEEPTAEPEPEPTEDPAPNEKPAPTFEDGAWVVGEDIEPGIYRAPDPSGGCYWERLRDFSGGLNSIIANGLAIGGPIVVEIDKSDEGFSSRGCGPWSADLSQVSVSKTRAGGGIWIIGTDLSPGTYRSTVPGGTCYWARLRDFRSDLNSILANDLPGRGSAIVEIKSSDAGFETHDCGTWEKV